jgi:hypothetical protein
MFGPIVRVCKSINKEECMVEVEVVGAKCTHLNGFLQGNVCVLRLCA